MSSLKVIKTSLTNFGLYINPYNGCAHGCAYCYAMAKTTKSSAEWQKAVPTKSFIENLKHDINILRQNPSEKGAIKDIMVSSFTDCYQPLEKEHRFTRQTIELLIANDLPFTVLTKSSTVLDDLSLFIGYEKCRVGLTITTLDDDFRKQIEPHTSTTDEKIIALEKLKEKGIKTYCSVEPITNHKASKPIAIVKRLVGVVDLFEFGMIKENQKLILTDGSSVDYDINFLIDKMNDVINHCKREKVTYCTASHSHARLKKYGLTSIPCPTIIP